MGGKGKRRHHPNPSTLSGKKQKQTNTKGKDEGKLSVSQTTSVKCIRCFYNKSSIALMFILYIYRYKLLYNVCSSASCNNYILYNQMVLLLYWQDPRRYQQEHPVSLFRYDHITHYHYDRQHNYCFGFLTSCLVVYGVRSTQ